MRTRLLIGAITGAMLLPGVVVNAQDATSEAEPTDAAMEAPTQTPVPSVTPPPGTEVLVSVFPTEVLGEEIPMPMLLSGPELLERVSPEGAAIFEQILADAGKAPEDLSTGIANVAFDGGGSVEFQAVRVAGGDANVFWEALVPLLEQSNLGPLTSETAELAGKPVAVLSDADDGSVYVRLHPSGDVVWIMAGDDESVVALLEALPAGEAEPDPDA